MSDSTARRDYETTAERECRVEAMLAQANGAEVPGFHVRTQIDDLIGKLGYLRSTVFIDVSDGLSALLDDLDEKVEAAIGDAEPVDAWYEAGSESWGTYSCSCGTLGVALPPTEESGDWRLRGA